MTAPSTELAPALKWYQRVGAVLIGAPLAALGAWLLYHEVCPGGGQKCTATPGGWHVVHVIACGAFILVGASMIAEAFDIMSGLVHALTLAVRTAKDARGAIPPSSGGAP
jgi:hypothetical protein